MIFRPRRLRRTAAIRDMAAETRLSPSMLVYPVFIREGKNIIEDIPAMPGQKRYSPDTFPKFLEETANAGIKSILLFGLPEHKDECGSGAWDENGVIQQALRVGKKNFPEMTFICDVCLCEYTSHGHCGILCGHYVDNDRTLEVLARTAVSHARAGADMVAPSDMMDGRVAAIRAALDENGFVNTPVMAYSAKVASTFYGPFRDAAGSAPAFGDRRSYQMDPHNGREAMRECELDVQEGADILMIKPAMPYLDLVRACRDRFDLPVAAYQVSGEYAMIKAAAKAGLIDEYGVMCESAVSIFRAGADILITYFACELADAIRKGDIG